MLQRSGGMGKAPDYRGVINLRSCLRVRVQGKKGTKGGLDLKIVDLISDKKNLDGNFLTLEQLRNDEDTRGQVGEV